MDTCLSLGMDLPICLLGTLLTPDCVWIGFEEFLYKGIVGVLGEMLSNFFQNPCFCFGHNLAITWPSLIQIE